jgi:protein tyrosine phosphatase (PTP) superfamily phosphohydrolase (DUF442 family)
LNWVQVDSRLATAGQPTTEQLKSLADEGYALVINLAPVSSEGSIPEEGGILSGLGVSYVNIPVQWEEPLVSDFEFFSAVMLAPVRGKVLVHCRLNMRASAFVFLFRVIYRRVSVEQALGIMGQVWVPDGPWREFVNRCLSDYNISAGI